MQEYSCISGRVLYHAFSNNIHYANASWGKFAATSLLWKEKKMVWLNFWSSRRRCWFICSVFFTSVQLMQLGNKCSIARAATKERKETSEKTRPEKMGHGGVYALSSEQKRRKKECYFSVNYFVNALLFIGLAAMRTIRVCVWDCERSARRR